MITNMIGAIHINTCKRAIHVKTIKNGISSVLLEATP